MAKPGRPHAFFLVLFLAAGLVSSRPEPCRASAVGDDISGIASRRTAGILLAGGVLALATHRFENADAEERTLGHGLIDGPADAGNVYGDGAVLGAGALALYGAGRLTHDANVRGAGSEMIRSLAYTSVIVGVLKVAVHRTRPDGGRYSFPSGHVAAAMAIAPVLSKHFGAVVAAPAYALAVSTALGRLEDRKHYLSDVAFGAAIGAAAGFAVTKTHLGFADFAVGPAGAGVSLRF